jgi:hypothetical protein
MPVYNYIAKRNSEGVLDKDPKILYYVIVYTISGSRTVIAAFVFLGFKPTLPLL